MRRVPDMTMWLKLAIFGLAGLLVACGGGGSSAPADTTITGSVVAAPVSGASVLVKGTGGNTIAGPVTTVSDGTYSITIPNSALSGVLIIESTGGTFDDEATSLNREAGRLATYVPGGSLSTGSVVHLTPASTIVQYMVSDHGKTHAEANAAFEAAFGYAVDTSVAPANATNPATDASQAQLLAGLRAAAFSQLTMDLGLMVVDQFALLPALARDIAHGGFNGQDAGGAVIVTGSEVLPTDIRFRFFWATLNFHSSDHNQTGLASSEIGSLPFVAGYVVGASSGMEVTVEDTVGTPVAGPVTVGSDGVYALDFSSLSGDLIFKSSAGTFGVMTAYVPDGGLKAGTMVHLSPASTIVQALVSDHAQSHADAQVAFKAAFGFALDTSIKPVDATANAPMGTGQPQLLAGLRAAAFAQLAAELPLELSALLSDLALDIADGTFDGGTLTPIDIQNRFTQALVNFHGGTTDETGLGNDQIGSLPFAKVALSTSYKVEYVPGTMAAMEGKTMFTLHITDHSGTTPLVTGTAVTLMPMMHMASMGMGMDMHGTPVGGCTEVVEGEYGCTVYYLMASKMMSGMSMGYWELMVKIGGTEPTTFYPQVMMDMDEGNTHKAVILRGQSDLIAGMMMPENRTYYLFKDGLTGTTGNHTFKLFIAAKESMESYPAVFVGQSLNNGTAYQLDVAAMSVEFSTDDGATWSFAASDADTNGHWSASGITGLTNGTQGTICVRLMVDDGVTNELKTTDGMPDDGANGHTCFTVTPGSM